MSSSRDGLSAWSLPDLRRAPAPAPSPAAAAASSEESAYQRGYADGCAAQNADATRAAEDATSALGAAAEALARAADDTQARIATTLPALAVAVARHLIEREVAADPSIVHALVSRALTVASLSGTVTVRLHPADLAAVGGMDGFAQPVGAPFELKWAADPGVHRGGCVVETPSAVVDGRVDRALLELYDRLLHE